MPQIGHGSDSDIQSSPVAFPRGARLVRRRETRLIASTQRRLAAKSIRYRQTNPACMRPALLRGRNAALPTQTTARRYNQPLLPCLPLLDKQVPRPCGPEHPCKERRFSTGTIPQGLGVGRALFRLFRGYTHGPSSCALPSSRLRSGVTGLIVLGRFQDSSSALSIAS